MLQACSVNEVVKAQTNKVRLARLKGELVDRSQAIEHVFTLARAERDAWLKLAGAGGRPWGLPSANSKQRIDPLIEEPAVLAERIAPARSRDSCG